MRAALLVAMASMIGAGCVVITPPPRTDAVEIRPTPIGEQSQAVRDAERAIGRAYALALKPPPAPTCPNMTLNGRTVPRKNSKRACDRYTIIQDTPSEFDEIVDDYEGIPYAHGWMGGGPDSVYRADEKGNLVEKGTRIKQTIKDKQGNVTGYKEGLDCTSYQNALLAELIGGGLETEKNVALGDGDASGLFQQWGATKFKSSVCVTSKNSTEVSPNQLFDCLDPRHIYGVDRRVDGKGKHAFLLRWRNGQKKLKFDANGVVVDKLKFDAGFDPVDPTYGEWVSHEATDMFDKNGKCRGVHTYTWRSVLNRSKGATYVIWDFGPEPGREPLEDTIARAFAETRPASATTQHPPPVQQQPRPTQQPSGLDAPAGMFGFSASGIAACFLRSQAPLQPCRMELEGMHVLSDFLALNYSLELLAFGEGALLYSASAANAQGYTLGFGGGLGMRLFPLGQAPGGVFVSARLELLESIHAPADSALGLDSSALELDATVGYSLVFGWALSLEAGLSFQYPCVGKSICAPLGDPEALRLMPVIRIAFGGTGGTRSRAGRP